jgi:hypothetical protein
MGQMIKVRVKRKKKKTRRKEMYRPTYSKITESAIIGCVYTQNV